MGAGIGAFVTMQILKERYEAFAQEEIDSVKEAFADKNVSNKKDEEKDK